MLRSESSEIVRTLFQELSLKDDFSIIREAETVVEFLSQVLAFFVHVDSTDGTKEFFSGGVRRLKRASEDMIEGTQFCPEKKFFHMFYTPNSVKNIPSLLNELQASTSLIALLESEYFFARQFQVPLGELELLHSCTGDLKQCSEKISWLLENMSKWLTQRNDWSDVLINNGMETILDHTKQAFSMLAHFEREVDIGNGFNTSALGVKRALVEYSDYIRSLPPSPGVFSFRKKKRVRKLKDKCMSSIVTLAVEESKFSMEKMGLVVPRAEKPKHRRLLRATGRRIHVGRDTTGGGYTSIRDAVANAETGDSIVIDGGKYLGGLRIDKEIELIGEGNESDMVVIEAVDEAAVHFSGKEGILCNVKLVQLKSSQSCALEITNGVLDVDGCDISGDNHFPCVSVHSGASLELKNSNVRSGRSAGMAFYDSAKGVVEDCEIFGHSRAGVEIENGANPTIQRNKIHGNTSTGIFIHDGGRGQIKNNDIYENSLSAIEVKTKGDPVVTSNSIYANKSAGIYVYEDGKGTYSENEIYENVKAGIEVRTGGNPKVINNYVHNGGDCGILVHEGGLGLYEGNDICNNAYAGVEIRTKANPEVCRNVIHKGRENGIFICNNGKGRIIGNDIFGCLKPGIEVRVGSHPTISGNKIHHNKDSGIYIYENSMGTVDSNDIFWNKCGIELRSRANPKITGNQIHDCKGSGIYSYDEASGTVSQNKIFKNARAGIELRDGSKSEIIDNIIYDGDGCGIFVYEKRTKAIVTNNTVYNNKMAGVECRNGASVSISDCNISSNGHVGIFVHLGGVVVCKGCSLKNNKKGSWSVSEDSKDLVKVDKKHKSERFEHIEYEIEERSVQRQTDEGDDGETEIEMEEQEGVHFQDTTSQGRLQGSNRGRGAGTIKGKGDVFEPLLD